MSLDPVVEGDERQNKKQIYSASHKKLVYTAIQNNKERLAMMVQVLE